MNDFWHFAAMAARRRLTLACILFTSLVVAAFWGANISVCYPVIKVVFAGKGAKQFVADEIATLQAKGAAAATEIARLETQLKETGFEDEKQAIRRRISVARANSETDQWRLDSLIKIQPWVVAYMPSKPFQTLVVAMVALLVGTLVKLVALSTNLMLVQEIVQRTALEIRSQLFRKSLRMDLEQFGEHGSSPLLTRLTHDIEHVADGLQTLLGRLVREPLKLLVCLGGAAYICWPLLLVVLATVPVMALAVSSLSRSVRRSNRRVMEEMTQLYSQVNQSLAAIRIVKAYNAQGFERTRFRFVALQYYRRCLRLAWYNALGRPLSEMLGMTMVIMAMLAGGYLVLNQQTSLFGIPMTRRPLEFGEVMLFFALLIGASDPARKMSEVWGSLQRGATAATRIREALRAPVRVLEPKQPKLVGRPHQRLSFEQVNYRYPAGPLVLEGMNLEIKHGETIAVVGPNGSGKSTLVSLLCRMDDPQGGRVCLDGVPLNEMSLRDLRRRIGLVTQHPVMFEDSILNNIRYGSPSATREAVIAAAKQAHADEFIRLRLVDGYETVIGSHGVRLSGGQMQRISLARAILRKPEIMILDEATSQIDVESEQLIHDALQDYLRGRTGIIITHRPSTLALAHRIAVVDQGRIADIGTHSELLLRNAFYRNLCGEPQVMRKSA